MRGHYNHRFILPSGVTVCIPSDEGRARGRVIVDDVCDRWSPKKNYFHLLAGGHVEAARRHANSSVIAKIDLAGFYHQVSRTKVHRSLKEIGFSQVEAWEAACESTVERDVGFRNFSLPFGFVQSPILASIALAHSALGRKIQQLNNPACMISVYVDDIIVSSEDTERVTDAISELRTAAALSAFHINEEKSEGPDKEIEVFNIHLGSGRMEITDERMNEFKDGVQFGHDSKVGGILNYVESVNRCQREELEGLIEQPA